MINNPYQAYKQQAVMTMTPGDMLTAVYDGLLKELALVAVAFEAKNYAEMNHRCQKAQVLLKHLQSSLDFKYEVSTSLNSLYDYFIHIVVQANVKKTIDGLDEVVHMITDLRDTYIQADKKTRSADAFGQSA